MQEGVEGGFTVPPEEIEFEIVAEIDALTVQIAAIGNIVRAHDADPRLSRRGAACVLHTFAVQAGARPDLVWAALTDPHKTGGSCPRRAGCLIPGHGCFLVS